MADQNNKPTQLADIALVMGNKLGRPSKLTPETTKKLVAAIETGNYFDIACKMANVHYTTFRKWMARGEQIYKKIEDHVMNIPIEGDVQVNTPSDDDIMVAKFNDEDFDLAPIEIELLDFYIAIKTAEAAAESRMVELWRGMAATDWRAAKELLARRYPERWGEHAKASVVELHHTGGVDVTHGGTVSLDARINQYAGIYEKIAERAISPGSDEGDGAGEQVHPARPDSETGGVPPTDPIS